MASSVYIFFAEGQKTSGGDCRRIIIMNSTLNAEVITGPCSFSGVHSVSQEASKNELGDSTLVATREYYDLGALIETTIDHILK